MLHPLLAMLLVLLLLTGLLLALRVLHRYAAPHPEVLRKLLHIGMGVVTLSFPWLFAESWPVWTLAGISILLFILVKMPSPLQRYFGSVVNGVNRASLGDIYFPITVAVLFQFAAHDHILYSVPILLLTLADAVAALIGSFYGQRHYNVAHRQKSTEGSIAFFTVAFLSTHIPLLLFTNIGRAESLLLALVIGLLVMLIEAVAWDGLDNLLVPLGGYLLLLGYRQMDVPTLLVLFIATLLWVAFVFFWRKHTTLRDDALLGAALVGYLTWSLGGWSWLTPPMILFISYTFLWPRPELLLQRPHNIYAVAAICAPALCWLAVARSLHHPELFYPYTVFYAAQLTFVGIASVHELTHKIATPWTIVRNATISWGLLFIPFLYLSHLTLINILLTLCAFVFLLPAAIIFNQTIPKYSDYEIEKFPWLRQAFAGILASLLALIPLWFF